MTPNNRSVSDGVTLPQIFIVNAAIWPAPPLRFPDSPYKQQYYQILHPVMVYCLLALKIYGK